MKLATAMQMERERLHIFELGRVVLLDIAPYGFARALRILRGKRQLEHLDQWKAAGRVVRDGPDHIHYAVIDLIVELRRRSSELHGRKDLAFEAALGFGRYLVTPR